MKKSSEEFTIFGKQVGYLIVTNVVVVVLTLVQYPILTKALGPEQYGIWALINTTISLISPFALLSFSDAIIQFLAGEKDNHKIRDDYLSALTVVFFLSTIFSLILFLCSNLFATYILKDLGATIYIQLSSTLIMLSSTFQMFLSYFRRGKNIGTFSVFVLGSNLLSVCLIVAALLLGYNLLGVIISTIISASIINLIAVIVIFKQIKFSRPRFRNIKSYLKWGIPLTPGAAIIWIISTGDRYVVNYFLGPAAAGIYNAAYGIGFYASFAIYPLGLVLYPYLSNAYSEGDTSKCKVYLEHSFKYLMMITIAAAVGLSVLARPLLLRFTTAEFISGTPIVSYTALSGIFFCFYQFFSYIIYLVGKTRLTIKFLSIAAVLNIILNFIFVPQLGIVGAGLASFIAYGILGWLTISASRKMIKFNLNIFFLLKCLIASGVMAVCLWLFKEESLLSIILSIVVGGLIYFGVLILLRGLKKEEITFFISFLKRRAK